MEIFIPLFAFIIGTAMGSFVTLASYRLPRDEEIVVTPSHCAKCNARLKFPDLFPLLSWLFQKGKCRYCHASISIRYPLIELALGLIFAALAYAYGITPASVLFALLATELLILIVTDLEEFIIPDSIQVAIGITGIAYQFYKHADAEGVVASMAFGLALGLALHYGYLYICKKDALGFGDVKLLCVVGAWLPFVDFVPFLFIAGVLGTVTGLGWRVAGRGAVFPFGPALALSLFINVLFPGLLQRLLVS